MNIKTFSGLEIEGKNRKEIERSVERYKKMGYVIEHSINFSDDITVIMRKDNS